MHHAPLILVLLLSLPSLAMSAPAPLPIGTEVEALIQPGAWMASPSWCTFNFVFRHKESGALGIGTAGHCVEHVGQEVDLVHVSSSPEGDVGDPAGAIPSGKDPTRCVHLGPQQYGFDPQCTLDLVDEPVGFVSDAAPRSIAIGTVEFRQADGVGLDFALVRIYEDLYPLVSPTMRNVGGPCGVHIGPLAERTTWPVAEGTVPIILVGHGLAVGTGGTTRLGAGYHPDGAHLDSPFMTVSVPVNGGDSGSPVRVVGGGAAGILTHGIATIGQGTRLIQALEMIGNEWELVTSPQCPPI